MDGLGWEAWVGIGAIAAGTIVAVLHAFAATVRHERHIHDTKLKAAGLKRVYAEQLAALEANRDLNDEVQIVGQGTMDMAKAA